MVLLILPHMARNNFGEGFHLDCGFWENYVWSLLPKCLHMRQVQSLYLKRSPFTSTYLAHPRSPYTSNTKRAYTQEPQCSYNNHERFVCRNLTMTVYLLSLCIKEDCGPSDLLKFIITMKSTRWKTP